MSEPTSLLKYFVIRFWTLTANPKAYRHPAALQLAKKKGLSPEGVSASSMINFDSLNIVAVESYNLNRVNSKFATTQTTQFGSSSTHFA